MSTFGRELKAAREKAGFETAKQFAEALGVEENRYRHWERGSAQPSLPMLARITRLLKVELSELVPAAYSRKSTNEDGGHRRAS
jgi:transcriptional regulator with XRE-family HTH domain